MRILFFILLIIPFTCFSQHKISKEKNILPDTRSTKRNALDVYYPKDTISKKEIFVFIHGGSWKHGDKKQYKFLGRRMAKKGKVAVIVNYKMKHRDYEEMADDCAKAIAWTMNNGSSYGGDTGKIFVSGHSAGGHLAALITLKKEYLALLEINSNPIAGVILIDGFGLNMHSYLCNPNYSDFSKRFHPVFSTDTAKWKEASPYYYISSDSIPFLIMTGEKTYPVIKEQSEEFLKAYKAKGNSAGLIVVKDKGHIGMILQFFNKKNYLYNECIKFMENQK
ncbi:MAG: alpha/beta hydrolase [Cytophagaceae bacterium]|nr:alpha/beta hydrolase [Cytophagaceae bacterium]